MILKSKLYTICLEYILLRIHNAEALITDAREAAGNETKSSAGDKYETAREMMQQEVDMNLRRVAEAKGQLQLLEQIDPLKTTTTVMPGSLVSTNHGNYYIAISASKLAIDGNSYMAISISSPIGLAMRGLKTGDSFRFNNRDYMIENLS
jgi:transcription elongation GreA/GreB family factor